MPEAVPTICIVDDDESVRRSLRRLLEANGFRVETFPDAGSYLDRNQSELWGCVILDVRMPGIDGLEMQAYLSEREWAAPIVFLTGHGDIPMSVRAIKAGAVDFLTKPVDETTLLEAVNNAVALHRQRLALAKSVADIRARIALLTSREMDVMRYVITGAPNKKIATFLGIAEKTVKVHRSRVMRKLEITSVTELLQACQQAGIKPVANRDR